MSHTKDDMALLAAWCHNRLDLIRFLARRCEATAKDLTQEIWFRLTRINHDVARKNPRALLFQIATKNVHRRW